MYLDFGSLLHFRNQGKLAGWEGYFDSFTAQYFKLILSPVTFQDEDDDVIIEDYTEEDEGESTEADRDINRLRERKEDLERKLKLQQRKKAQIEVGFKVQRAALFQF